MNTASKCGLCGCLHQRKPARCRSCNYPQFTEISLSVAEYCANFGHDGGETRVPGTAQYEGERFDALEEDGCVIGGCDMPVYSHEYLFHCARCGFERRTRRE